MNLHFPYPRIFSLIQRAMPQAFGDAAKANPERALPPTALFSKAQNRARFYSSAQQQPKV